MKRQSDVHVRVTREEKELLKRRAEEEGCDFSTWVRDGLVALATGEIVINRGVNSATIRQRAVCSQEPVSKPNRPCAECRRRGRSCCPNCAKEISREETRAVTNTSGLQGGPGLPEVRRGVAGSLPGQGASGCKPLEFQTHLAQMEREFERTKQTWLKRHSRKRPRRQTVEEDPGSERALALCVARLKALAEEAKGDVIA